MNSIILRGIIHNIEYSHTIKNTEFYKAQLEVERNEKHIDFITIKFKKQYCAYNEGDFIELKGNLRSYSYTEDEKNKVSLYVFTYFDKPTEEELNETGNNNTFFLDGRVCKINSLYTTKTNNHSLQFILANNLYDEARNLKFNSYLPIVVWGNQAIELSKHINVNDEISIKGEMHSRAYQKNVYGEIKEFSVQELVAQNIE